MNRLLVRYQEGHLFKIVTTDKQPCLLINDFCKIIIDNMLMILQSDLLYVIFLLVISNSSAGTLKLFTKILNNIKYGYLKFQFQIN